MIFQAPTEHVARNLVRNLRRRGFSVTRDGRRVVVTGDVNYGYAWAVAERYAAIKVCDG